MRRESLKSFDMWVRRRIEDEESAFAFQQRYIKLAKCAMQCFAMQYFSAVLQSRLSRVSSRQMISIVLLQ